MIANIFGALALSNWVISVQQKKKKNILIFQIIANILYGIQYFLLSVYTAGSMNFISVLRLFLTYVYEGKKKHLPLWLLICFICIIIGVGVVTYSGPLSLIPILISILYSYSTYQSNMTVFRLSFLIAAFVWLFYNNAVGAYTAMIGNTFEIVSGIISFVRMDILKRGSKLS